MRLISFCAIEICVDDIYIYIYIYMADFRYMVWLLNDLGIRTRFCILFRVLILLGKKIPWRRSLKIVYINSYILLKRKGVRFFQHLPLQKVGNRN